MSNPTSCTGCGKAISGAYEAGSYSCSECGTGVEINPTSNPGRKALKRGDPFVAEEFEFKKADADAGAKWYRQNGYRARVLKGKSPMLIGLKDGTRIQSESGEDGYIILFAPDNPKATRSEIGVQSNPVEKDARMEFDGLYHKVGEAGRLSLFVAKDNMGTHWMVTLDGEIYEKDYRKRISVKQLRQRCAEWETVYRRSDPDAVCPFALPEGTPTTWKRYEGAIYSLTGN